MSTYVSVCEQQKKRSKMRVMRDYKTQSKINPERQSKKRYRGATPGRKTKGDGIRDPWQGGLPLSSA